MPIKLDELVKQTPPQNTILFFGAGSSMPSGGPSGWELSNMIAKEFGLATDKFTLTEIATLAEKRRSRRELIEFLQKKLNGLKPTGSILNVPLLPWKSIYTTNFDTIIEQAFSRSGVDYAVFRTNFDFGARASNNAQKIYKVHGCIESDASLGHNGRIIITENDYLQTEDYRQIMFRNLETELMTANVLIIGYSLADPNIKELITKALKIKYGSGAPGKIFLLLKDEDIDRAALYEEKGIQVCFGSLDDFFSNIKYEEVEKNTDDRDDDFLNFVPTLRSVTWDIKFETRLNKTNAARMFNGQAASYGDISSGLTFDRDIVSEIENYVANTSFIACLIGAAGVGKTTACRQVMLNLVNRGYHCWEHKDDFQLESEYWMKIAQKLSSSGNNGALFIDDAHNHMRAVNDLIEALAKSKITCLKLILSSSKPHWNPRMKSPFMFTLGRTFDQSQLSHSEINSLLRLIDQQPTIQALIERKFLGFSKAEQRRRLEDRCGADMFVCLKNIFAFEKIDDIILREYAELPEIYQDIYRTVAAMEAAGVQVHRQLVIRTLGINSASIAQTLENLTDIITEYSIDKKAGLYGWRGRHGVIVQTIADYKFSNENELYDLFENIISNLNPTYRLEIRTLTDLCDRKHGIGRISNRDRQNVLLKKMISLAPAQRVPRHRLIQNHIASRSFDEAETEIRMFEGQMKIDAPVQRYKVTLLSRRASETPGLMKQDRIAIFQKALKMAEQGIAKFSNDKNLYREYCEVAIEYLRLTGDWSAFDAALEEARSAFDRLLDPELSAIVASFETKGQRIQGGSAA